MRSAAAAAAACLLVACLLSFVGERTNSPSVLYPEHMVDKAAQYGYGYGKPGVGYGPTVWAEEARQGEENQFPWPMSSERWWRDYDDGPGLSNDGRAYPIPYIPHLRDDLTGGDMFDSIDTPADAAPDHTGGGSPYLAWDAYAYTPWVRSITPTKAPPGEWHQRRWNKVLRALWDKKYYLKPYYASEPLHSPVLRMLHLTDYVSPTGTHTGLLKDYLPDMGDRTGDGRGERPESQRIMATGAPSRGRNECDVVGSDCVERHDLHWRHGTSGPEVNPKNDIKLAATRRLERKAKAVAREANGGHETQHLQGSDVHQHEDRVVARGSRSFYSSWGGGQEALASSDDEAPPSSPGGVARWWKQRKQVRVPDAGDIWKQSSLRRQRAQERVVAKAHLLGLCFGSLNHHPAKNLVSWSLAPLADGGPAAANKKREMKKDEACRLLRQAGHSDLV